MSAWVTRLYYDSNDLNKRGRPKRKREKCNDKLLLGVQGGDRFIVCFYDPLGKLVQETMPGCGRPAKRLALDRQEKLNAQMVEGTYEPKNRATWDEVKAEYLRFAKSKMRASSVHVMEFAFAHFERIIGPKLLKNVTTKTIDDYIAARSAERGIKPGSKVSTDTINKEVRCIRCMLRKAHKWGSIAKLPEFSFFKKVEPIPTFINEDEFGKIYEACKVATMPADRGYDPADWWRALLVTAICTGWRAKELITWRWDDCDLQTGRTRLRGKNTKNGRHYRLTLAPMVVEHLQRIRSLSQDEVFGWFDDRKELWEEFHRIQRAAGVKRECRLSSEHACTEACGLFGFHDLRRSFATFNAERMTPNALQRHMRHSDSKTTQLYINLAAELNKAAANVYTPKLPAATVA